MQETIRRECTRSARYFINRYCKIQPREGGTLVPFRLFPYQLDLLSDFLTYPELIILKARQLGVTELVAAYCVWLALKSPITVIIISQGDTEAKEFVRRVRVIWANLPAFLRIPAIDERKITSLELVNGSRILPFPATEGAGRSFTAQVLVLDEWAKQRYQAEIYAAAKPAVSGQIIGISTADGAGNFFHQQWQLARQGHGAHAVFIPWHARPDRDADWYRATTGTMLDWQKAQEFPTTEHEAFILSGRPVFDLDALTTLAQGCEKPLTETPLGTDTQGRPQGYQRIWQAPEPGRRYVAGADTAEGTVKGDYSSAVILDWEDGTEVAELHGHWEPAIFAHHLAILCAGYNHALLGVERNNHGHTVLLALDKLEGYGKHLYHHTEYDAKTKTSISKPAGWDTTSKSKPIMIDALGVAIKEQRPYRSALFLAEAQTYTYKDNGEMAASGSLHDDRVIAYAIAEQLRKAPRTQSVLAMGAASGGWGKTR